MVNQHFSGVVSRPGNKGKRKSFKWMEGEVNSLLRPESGGLARMAIGREAKLCHLLALDPGRKTGSHPCPLHIGQLVEGVRGLDLESDSLGLNLNSATNRSDLPSLFPHFYNRRNYTLTSSVGWLL